MPIQFLVIGDEAMLRRSDHVGRYIAEEIAVASAESALWLEASMKMFIAPHSKTGNLERTTRAEVEHVAGENVWKVVTKVGARYGIYVNSGTGIYHQPDPHTPWIIEPHPPKKALSFMYHGQRVFARRVVHRGARPVRFIENSWDANRERIQRRYEQIPGRVIRRIETGAP